MYSYFAPLIGALLILFHGSSIGAASIIFQDDFESGASSLWGHEVGDWSDLGGVYRETNGPLQPQTEVNYSSLPFVLTNFTVDIDVNDINDGGVWLRSQDNKNGVLLITGGDGGTAGGFADDDRSPGLIGTPAASSEDS